MSLDGNKFCKSLFFRQPIGLCQLPCETVGNADIPSFSRLHNIVQSLHDVIKRRLVIPHMINVQIHVVHAEIFKALIDHALYMLLPCNSPCNLILCTGQEFCRHHHLVTLGKIPQRPSHILLACAALITDCRVKEIDTKFQALPDYFTGMFLVKRP